MVCIRQAMRICKICVGCPQTLCLLVHHGDKIFHGTAHILCDQHGCVVGRIDKKDPKRLIHGHGIPGLQPAEHRPGFCYVNCAGSRKPLVQAAVL